MLLYFVDNKERNLQHRLPFVKENTVLLSLCDDHIDLKKRKKEILIPWTKGPLPPSLIVCAVFCIPHAVRKGD